MVQIFVYKKMRDMKEYYKARRKVVEMVIRKPKEEEILGKNEIFKRTKKMKRN